MAEDGELLLEGLHLGDGLGDEVLVLDWDEGQVMAGQATHLSAPEPRAVYYAAGGEGPPRGSGHVPGAVRTRGQTRHLRVSK